MGFYVQVLYRVIRATSLGIMPIDCAIIHSPTVINGQYLDVKKQRHIQKRITRPNLENRAAVPTLKLHIVNHPGYILSCA